MSESLDFLDVHFCYDTLAKPLFSGLTARFPLGWTGIVGANGAGKSTLLRLAVGELSPLSGAVVSPPGGIYCQQRTDLPPEALRRFLSLADAQACRLRGELGLESDWADRWDTLSHGERKRAQIAEALWRQPPVLALDEPSNHIDAQARELLLKALLAFRGIGLLVSHDRRLLDGLCRQRLFLEHGQAEMRRGGYTQGRSQGQAQKEHLRRQHVQAKSRLAKIEQEMVHRRERSAAEPHVRSKRKLARGDSDGRARIDLARLTDGKSGASLRQLEGRASQAAKELASIRVIKEYETGIWLPEARSQRDWLFRLDAGRLEMGEGGPVLEFPELALPADGRVALRGPNGTGKSTLLRHIVGRLSLPPERVLYMPQEVPAEESRRVLEEVRALNHDRLGQVLNIVSRLGSDAKPLLETELPSPGKTRKLLLALGIVRASHLILMDEPTNHLDLPSIECLEEALEDCPCGLLLVSHDEPFLRKLTRTVWTIERVDARRTRLEVAQSWD